MDLNYVTFYGPGRRQISLRIDSWDVETAKDMVRKQELEPYAFNFCTRRRNDDEMDSRIIMSSAMYYLGIPVEEPEEGDVVLQWP